MRLRASASLSIMVFSVLPLAGCYQGAEGTVSSQRATGNGTDFTLPLDAEIADPAILVQDATIVADPADGTRASLIFTLVNSTDANDTLSEVVIPAGTAIVTPGPIEVAPREAVKVGGSGQYQIDISDLAAAAGSYTDVTMRFAAAGSATVRLAVVPGLDYYSEYAPSMKPNVP